MDSDGYKMFAASRMRSHGTFVMIESLVVQSLLATFRNSR